MTSIEVTAGEVRPALAKAIVAAQRQAQTLRRDGKGQHGAYTSSDEIAGVAREVLTANGLAWVRLGVELHEPALHSCELGNQAYVGDLVERWALVHESGGVLWASGSRMPVIASKGRPHDKAVGASLTYDAGAVLRGLLCLDREDKSTAVDQRHDEDDGRPQPEPRQAPSKLEALQAAVAAKVEAYAAAYKLDKPKAWGEACVQAGYPGALGNGRGPFGCGFEELPRINDALKKALAMPRPEVTP
jgi:hypothetical protein